MQTLYVPVEPHPIPATDLACDVERDVIALLEPGVRIPDTFLHSVAEQYGEFEAWSVEMECGRCLSCDARFYDPDNIGICELCDDRETLRADAMTRWQQVQDARVMGEIEVQFYSKEAI